MVDHLDIMPIGVKNECRIVLTTVLRTQSCARPRSERRDRTRQPGAGFRRRMLCIDARASRLFGTGTVNSCLWADSIQHRLEANR